MHRTEIPSVLALGLDPAAADPASFAGFTPDAVRAFIDAQLQRVRDLGCEVVSCLVDSGVADQGAAAEAAVRLALAARRFDCVMFGAGLRAPGHLLLFERLLNRVHADAPGAKLCFNSSPSDTAEAVRRWM